MHEEDQAQHHDPLFSDGEVIAIAACLIALDIADIAEVGVPVSDILSGGIQAYEYKKGTNGTLQVITSALELIPGVDILPIRSVAFGLLVWGDRHPDGMLAKLIKVAEVASELEGKGKAGGAGGEGAAFHGGAANDNNRRLVAANDNVAATGSGGDQTSVGVSEENVTAQGSGSSQGSGSAGQSRKDGRAETGEGIGAGEIPGTSGEEEAGEESLTPEERRKKIDENFMRGRDIENLELEMFGADQMLEDVEAPALGTKDSEFNPNEMGPQMTTKPNQKPLAQNDNEKRYNSKEIDLRNKDGEGKKTA